MRVGELVVDALGAIEVDHQGVGGQCVDGIATRALPGRVGRERLVLAQLVHEAAHVLGERRGHRQRLDPAVRAAAAAEQLDDQRLVEARQHPAGVRDVDREHLVLLVEDGVHRVDRELELMDAAAREPWSSCGSSLSACSV